METTGLLGGGSKALVSEETVSVKVLGITKNVAPHRQEPTKKKANKERQRFRDRRKKVGSRFNVCMSRDKNTQLERPATP